MTADEWAELLGFPLELAAAQRNREVAAKLVNAGAAIAGAVHAAVRGGSERMVSFLLKNGGSPGDPDHKGETPLQAAVRVGSEKMTRSLLLRGADPNAVSRSGGMPLYWAARHGDTSVVEALLAAGADVTIREREGHLSPLDAAAGFGHTGVMRALVEHGADVDAAGSAGRTALYWSVFADKANAADLLVEAGVDVEVRESGGDLAGLAPLHLALCWSRYDAAVALLKNGAGC
eukprot:g7532.t1